MRRSTRPDCRASPSRVRKYEGVNERAAIRKNRGLSHVLGEKETASAPWGAGCGCDGHDCPPPVPGAELLRLGDLEPQGFELLLGEHLEVRLQERGRRRAVGRPDDAGVADVVGARAVHLDARGGLAVVRSAVALGDGGGVDLDQLAIDGNGDQSDVASALLPVHAGKPPES